VKNDGNKINQKDRKFDQFLLNWRSDKSSLIQAIFKQ